MQNSRIHDYVCDYVEGTLNPELSQALEELMKSNEIIRSFVINAQRGRAHLKRYASSVNNTSQPKDSPENNKTKQRRGLKKHLNVVWFILPLASLIGLAFKIRF